MIEIPLSKQGKHKGKYVAIVSDEDKDLASVRWAIQIKRHGNYVYRKNPDAPVQGRKHLDLHRVIMERVIAPMTLQKGQVVDHINGNGLDNRRDNLRIATPSQNAMNSKRHKDNRTGYKGVTYFRRDRNYRATIYINGKVTHIGYFDTAEEAHEAYNARAKQEYGEFAKLENQ